MAWDLIKTILIALISSGGVTAVITRYLEKHSKIHNLEAQIADINKVLDRHGEALEALVHCQMELLNVLHEKGTINGESQKLRETFSDYIYDSQAKGFKAKKEKAV